VLRRRVELLEEEAAAKPVVDVDAFAALQEEVEAAAAVGEGLREEVSFSYSAGARTNKVGCAPFYFVLFCLFCSMFHSWFCFVLCRRTCLVLVPLSRLDVLC